MGLLDDAKDKLDEAKDKVTDLIGDKEDEIKGGIDKAADVIESKVGHGDVIDKVAEKAKDIVDHLAGDSGAPVEPSGSQQSGAGESA